MDSQLYIGLMSGTSLDGVDAVLVDFSSAFPQLLGTHMEPMKAELRNELLALTQPGDNEIDRMGRADVLFADLQVQVIRQLLNKCQVSPTAIRAIGSHGQTIRHRPDFDTPFTLQIGDPSRMVEQLGIDVIADFRRRDMAAGGEGAPLVPAFHDAYIRHPGKNRAVVNIGGIANVTLLNQDTRQPTLGYDTGPGNVLMDAWIEHHLGRSYDLNGIWAKSGQIDQELLDQLLATPYLQLPPPKSTGRELFHLQWLQDHIEALDKPMAPEDAQATLLELTARSIADNLMALSLPSLEIYLCGGGARNLQLVQRLKTLVSPHFLSTTDSLGLPCEWLEATAFAWLAKACLERRSGNLPAVTGANGTRILGAIYQA